MKKTFLFLMLSCFFACDHEDEYFKCTSGLVIPLSFEIISENNLKGEVIPIGQSFKLSISNPIELQSDTNPGSINLPKFDYATAITLSEYVYYDSSFTDQIAALDYFDINILKGEETEVEYSNIWCDSANHSLILAPLVDSDQMIIEVEFTPRKTGTYFLFLQNATDARNFQIGNYTGDNCPNSVSFRYNNITRNNYDFLEGSIADFSAVVDYLESYSLVAFRVE